MARRRQPAAATYLESAEKKADKLDWNKFNFLGNLLVFCAAKELSVPPESGVQFHISKEPQDDVLCILFKTDRSPDPLVTDRNQPRPDYLVLYKTRAACIFTIVEMKGRTENGLERGIEQIVYLRDRLKQELSQHFPLAANAVYQGILLCPPDAQVPRRQITKEADQNFIVTPLLYQHKAELFPYISKRNTTSDRYEHQRLPHNEELTFLERLLVRRALPHREEDAQYYADYKPGNNVGVYINYALSNDKEYASFIANESGCKVVVKANDGAYVEDIKTALAAIGWERKFACMKLPTENSSEPSVPPRSKAK